MKKLKLNDLKVKSFVTNYTKESSKTIKGGEKVSVRIECPIAHTHDTLDRNCTIINPPTYQPGGTCGATENIFC